MPGGASYLSGNAIPERVVAYMRSNGSLAGYLAAGAIVDTNAKPSIEKSRKEFTFDADKEKE
jgi:hypothetical protein